MAQFGGAPAGTIPSKEGLASNIGSNIQGINPLFSSASGKYMSGARTIIRINGKIAAFAFNVSWRISTAQDEINTIDDWTPYEYAPKRVTVEGTIGGFHIPGQGMTKQLIMPNVLSFMFHKYITIEIRDRTTDNILFKTEKAVITSSADDLRANEIGTFALGWKAIGWANDLDVDNMAPAGVKDSLLSS